MKMNTIEVIKSMNMNTIEVRTNSLPKKAKIKRLQNKMNMHTIIFIESKSYSPTALCLRKLNFCLSVTYHTYYY